MLLSKSTNLNRNAKFEYWEDLLKQLPLTIMLLDKFDICMYLDLKCLNKPLTEVLCRNGNIHSIETSKTNH